MNVIIAIDSFKGCLTSALANQSAADGILSVSPDAKVVQMPVSDGGEGWLSAYHAAIGGELITVPVRDPMMRWIEAQYLVQDQTAVVEIAQASGLPLLTPEERNPMVATSYGTGQLIVDAVRRGCKEIIVGLGGSATSDCGKGMLRALIDAFANQGSWDDITELQKVRFTIATDVTNPLCGPEGAAHVFAPQKGATPEMVETLDAIAQRFAALSAKHFGFDRQNEPGAGAAGGLGYAFLQYMNADARHYGRGLCRSSDVDGKVAFRHPSECKKPPSASGLGGGSYWRSPDTPGCRFYLCGMHQSPGSALRGSHEARSSPAEHQDHRSTAAQKIK